MLTSKKQKLKKQKKLRHAEYYDCTAAFDKLYADSKRGLQFHSLMRLIASEENILLAYRNIKRNKGSFTKGADGLSMRELEKLPQADYVASVKNMLQWYKPKPVRRVEIPKPNGKMRPLGIPCIWDRIVQQCILQVLEPICEAKFHERSNGFRPNRSAGNAIAQCYFMMQVSNLHFVVDIDIKGFFNNVDHAKLRQQMWELGIRDKKLLCVVTAMLKAPIQYPDGRLVQPTKGTPQGGILSPLLSNIVLNELDWWIASQWETIPTRYPYKNGYKNTDRVSRRHTYEMLRKYSNLKEMQIVRYADDFKIFCRKRSDADKVFQATKMWLYERLRLQISEEKSRVINLKKSYSEFLGFKLKAVKKGKSYTVRSHMCDKAIERTAKQLTAQADKIERAGFYEAEFLEICQYNSMVIGLHNYFRYATHICKDCDQIAYRVNTVLKRNFGKRLKKKGTLKKGYIHNTYGSSGQLRFIDQHPICPLGYIRTKAPLWKKRSICKYTPEGRTEIHQSLGVNMGVLHALMQSRIVNKSVEFMDNRLSLYAAQQGKCAVTKQVLELDEIHCHHKVPLGNGGTDRYSNLTLLHVDVHTLLHANEPQIISKYLDRLQLDVTMLEKLNKLRQQAGLSMVGNLV